MEFKLRQVPFCCTAAPWNCSCSVWLSGLFDVKPTRRWVLNGFVWLFPNLLQHLSHSPVDTSSRCTGAGDCIATLYIYSHCDSKVYFQAIFFQGASNMVMCIQLLIFWSVDNLPQRPADSAWRATIHPNNEPLISPMCVCVGGAEKHLKYAGGGAGLQRPYQTVMNSKPHVKECSRLLPVDSVRWLVWLVCLR